jgi:hypothetical protein
MGLLSCVKWMSVRDGQLLFTRQNLLAWKRQQRDQGCGVPRRSASGTSGRGLFTTIRSVPMSHRPREGADSRHHHAHLLMATGHAVLRAAVGIAGSGGQERGTRRRAAHSLQRRRNRGVRIGGLGEAGGRRRARGAGNWTVLKRGGIAVL